MTPELEEAVGRLERDLDAIGYIDDECKGDIRRLISEVKRLSAPSGPWRTGTKVKLNVYENNAVKFQCHTPEDAERIVRLLNRAVVADSSLSDKEKNAVEEYRTFCKMRRSLTNISMAARLEKCKTTGSSEAWDHVIRLCEAVGVKASILRDGCQHTYELDTSIQEETGIAIVPQFRCRKCGNAIEANNG